MGRPEALRRWVAEVFGHELEDPAPFELALTHRSAAAQNNERLEFLGDAVLGLVVAQLLFERFPEADEGSLSRLRARIVNGAALAALAAASGLGQFLVLGPGELKTGGERRESILADAFEALVGAIFLEGGLSAAQRAVRQTLREPLEALRLPDDAKDAKTQLQEWLQGRGLALPRYRVESVGGDLHAQVFHVVCEIEALGRRAEASGTTRRRAEQAAAAQLLSEVDG